MPRDRNMSIGTELLKEAGETLFHQGEQGRVMYVILDGTIDIHVKSNGMNVPVARMSVGDFLGEMSLLEGLPRSGTAVAVQACRLLQLNEDEFRHYIADDSSVAWRIMKALSLRIRNLNRELTERIGQDLQEVSLSLNDNTKHIHHSIEEIAASASEIETNQLHLAEEIKLVQQISKKISSSLTFIQRVSYQTHILGLNAGIEASRSQEFGRGFAVIAEEIRKLSTQSKENAELIATLTEQIEVKMNLITSAAETSTRKSNEQASATRRMVASTRDVSGLADRLNAIADSLKS